MLTKNGMKNFFAQFDYVLIAMVVVLSFIGLLMIYSATTNSDTGLRQMIVQSVALMLGLSFMFFVASIDYENYTDFVKHIYIGSVILLIFVLLFGSGKEETGANSWIRIGGIGIQPSEFVKIAFAITFSIHLTKVKEDINSFHVMIGLLGHFALLAGLVIIQNDTGTALVFTFMFICMLFVAGISYKYIVIALGGGLAFAPIAWFVLMQPYQRDRILVFLNPERDASGSGYQVLQSKIAIGSGEFLGRGYLSGPQNRLAMLPEKDTDFIFGVVGEEFGFIGAMIVMILLILIIVRCIYIAQRAKNDMGSYMCVGIASMLIFHTFENISMCIGLMPVTGIPLPFVSYGGSSLMTNYIAIGLVLSVWLRRKVINFSV